MSIETELEILADIEKRCRLAGIDKRRIGFLLLKEYLANILDYTIPSFTYYSDEPLDAEELYRIDPLMLDR